MKLGEGEQATITLRALHVIRSPVMAITKLALCSAVSIDIQSLPSRITVLQS